MPAYAYRAVHTSGRVSRGQMDAANENELAHYLRESGMELIHARESNARTFHMPQIAGRQATPRALAHFCTRMHDLLLSGIPFLDALRDVAASTDNKAFSDRLGHVARAIDNGGGIAASFALYPWLFSPVFTAILGAGENSGDMTVVFEFLSRYADASAHSSERLRHALRYPIFLLFVAGGAIAFMLSAVVPEVAQFLVSLQSKLPFATRMLVALSKVFMAYGWILIVGTVFIVLTIISGRKIFPSFAIALDGMLLRIPVIGDVAAKTALARFAHSFAILFRSGCDVPACLRQARGVVGNHALRAGIENAERRVQAGAALSQALDGVMPHFATGLLRTGERSGNIGKSLDDIAIAYDREAQTASDNFIALLEPCLTLAIGILLAWTVIAVLGPLYGSLTVLGGRM